MKFPKWIAFDLDGTLAHYDKFGEIGEPIPKMLERAKWHIAQGDTIKIFTARCSEPGVWEEPIKDWCEKHGLNRPEVTNIKDMGMELLYDDKARQVIFNKGLVVGEDEDETKIFNNGLIPGREPINWELH